MLEGLMQQAPLLVSGILRYAATAHSDVEVVSRLIDEPVWRYDWAGCALRARKLAQALARLGIQDGDRVTSLAWNTHRHLELMYGVPGSGAVLHTANPRLSDDQLAFTINHAGARALFFDSNMRDCVRRIRDRLTTIEHYVLLAAGPSDDGGLNGFAGYEELLDAEGGDLAWSIFDENSAAILCYTSGTTGDPKGVLYSHRSVVLQAMAASLGGALGLTPFDVIMPCSSLYHATAWGLPFAGALSGCKFVLPCDKFDGASIHSLVRDERVTMSGGVPTIWTTYLQYLDGIGETVGTLRQLLVGGSAVPKALIHAYRVRGVAVLQGWGMTETNALGVIATPTPKLVARSGADGQDALSERQGRAIFGVELKLVDESGSELPWDGESAGTLMVRGPWVADSYYPDLPTAGPDGWLDTGDVATIDDMGFMRITDRKKDMIKSGGEWVSSIDLENAAMACPGVRIAAVVGVYHPRWEERPLMVVEGHEGAGLTTEALRAFLEPRVAKWCLPDAILFATVPLTSVGKIDKKALRQRYRYHLAGGS